jgi:hypothetical protein
MPGLASHALLGGWQGPGDFAALANVSDEPAAPGAAAGALSAINATLFEPLAPVVDQAIAWRPETPGIPATALPALGACVQSGLHAADTMAAVWARAAAILDDAAEPVAWQDTGLSARRFPAVAAAAAAVLREAAAIAALARIPPATANADAALRTLLERVAARGAFDWALILQVLLMRLPAPLELMRHLGAARTNATGGTKVAAAMRPATELAIGALLARLTHRHAAAGPLDSTVPLHAAALEARRLAALLAAISDNAGAERRRRMEGLRQQLEARCQERFVAGLAVDLLEPIATLAAPPESDALIGLEATARDLRRLETEARHFGSAVGYEALLRHASTTLAALPADASLPLIARVRLIEILTGPEDAVALLAG